MNSKVAIVIVNYNGWKDTIECLHSLEELSYRNFEVFIVDNASTNESIKEIKMILNKISINVTLIEANQNKGFAAGNNIGIREAMKKEFDYYLMLNNDTLVKSNLLEKLIEPFEQENVGATIGQIYYATEKNRIWYAGGELNIKFMKPIHYKYNQYENQHISEEKNVSFATGCCICCSAKLLERVGLWNEEFFLYEEDVELSFRIINSGYKIIYNSDAIIYHKVSASTGKITGISEYYQIRNRLWIIKTYKVGLKKVYAQWYTLLLGLNRIIKGEYQLRPLTEAYLDYRTGKLGRKL